MKRARGPAVTWKVVWGLAVAALALAGAAAQIQLTWQIALPGHGSTEDRAPAGLVEGRAPTPGGVLPEGGPSLVGRAFPRPPRGRAVSTHSFGPAPETVAPSSEVALSASQSPPAVTSAPRPAPAPHLAIVPAPEPSSPPRPEEPRVSQMARLPEAAVVAPHQDMHLATPPHSPAWSEQNVRAIRFDAAYYYGSGRSARQLAEDLTRSWQEKGINLVYYYAYNRVYGARYYTRYPGNVMEDFGRQDLLGHMIRAAHRRDIKVIAWFYGPQHKQMWEAHPDWRQKTIAGRDYKPDADSYFLCVRNPEVAEWWHGLIEEVLVRYPELDGIDISEAQVDLWGDHACFCEHCREQFAAQHPAEPMPGAVWRRFRAEGLTDFLLSTIRLAHQHGKEAHLTTVFTAGKDGRLLNPNAVRDATAFDLQQVLSSPDRPDIVQAELIWQQWATTYGDGKTFSPGWTAEAVRQAKSLVGGRARVIAHLELTDFGSGRLDADDIGLTVAAAVRGEPYGIDLYDAHLLERTEGVTQHLQMAWLGFQREPSL